MQSDLDEHGSDEYETHGVRTGWVARQLRQEVEELQLMEMQPQLNKFSPPGPECLLRGRVAISARSPRETALRVSRGRTATVIEGHLPRSEIWREGTGSH